MELRKVTMPIASLVFTLTISGCLSQENLGSQDDTSVGTPTNTPAEFTTTPAPQSLNPTSSSGTPSSPPEPAPRAAGGVTINDGADFTNSTQVSVKFTAEAFTFDMKVSLNATCSGGDWQGTSEYLNLVLPRENGLNSISVQYRDSEGYVSQCYQSSITHDNKGPAILISKYPLTALEEGSSTELAYESTDDAGIVSVKCQLNQTEKPCGAGANTVSISAMPEGDYNFRIEAIDSLGNSSHQTVSWSVTSSTRRLTQSIRVNGSRKVDILFVIDNSGSMMYEQKSMASRTSNFLSIISGLDWQIGITTTDPRDIELGDGRLLPIFDTRGQSYIIDPSIGEPEAQRRLSMTLQRPEVGSGSEQPIFATYRALERSLSNDNRWHQQLFRSDSQLAVVVISDEDESANGPKNDPGNLTKFISETYRGQKSFSFHSIITRPGDQQCLSTYGATYGERLKMFTEITGGVTGSVCELDYAAQVQGIASGIRNLLKTITLDCAPLQQFPISVSRNGTALTTPFTVEGVNLKFASELEPGDYSVQYRCLR